MKKLTTALTVASFRVPLFASFTAFAAQIMPCASAQEKAKVALIANLSSKQTRAKVTELALVEWETGQRGHYRTAKSWNLTGYCCKQIQNHYNWFCFITSMVSLAQENDEFKPDIISLRLLISHTHTHTHSQTKLNRLLITARQGHHGQRRNGNPARGCEQTRSYERTRSSDLSSRSSSTSTPRSLKFCMIIDLSQSILYFNVGNVLRDVEGGQGS